MNSDKCKILSLNPHEFSKLLQSHTLEIIIIEITLHSTPFLTDLTLLLLLQKTDLNLAVLFCVMIHFKYIKSQFSDITNQSDLHVTRRLCSMQWHDKFQFQFHQLFSCSPSSFILPFYAFFCSLWKSQLHNLRMMRAPSNIIS